MTFGAPAVGLLRQNLWGALEEHPWWLRHPCSPRVPKSAICPLQGPLRSPVSPSPGCKGWRELGEEILAGSGPGKVWGEHCGGSACRVCCGFRDAARAGHGILGVCREKSLLVARQRDAGEPELVCTGGGCESGGGLKGDGCRSSRRAPELLCSAARREVTDRDRGKGWVWVGREFRK